MDIEDILLEFGFDEEADDRRLADIRRRMETAGDSAEEVRALAREFLAVFDEKIESIRKGFVRLREHPDIRSRVQRRLLDKLERKYVAQITSLVARHRAHAAHVFAEVERRADDIDNTLGAMLSDAFK